MPHKTYKEHKDFATADMFKIVRVQVSTAVKIQIEVFWVVTPCEV